MKPLLLAMFILLVILLAGCSSAGDISPLTPSTDNFRAASNNRVLWGYWTITIDESTGAEVVPLRDVAGHFNVLGFLEKSPCNNCLDVPKVEFHPDQVDATIRIRHPFPGTDLFTGFDVRGICFLPGTFQLPNLLRTMPDFRTEDYLIQTPGTYIGYTNNFNPVSGGNGYIKGNLTPWPKEMLTADLGAFIYYATEPNVRNAFRTSDVISNKYSIRRLSPGPLVFGYAVDASWENPSMPVVFPDSFGEYANALESWKIDISVDDSQLTETGGYATVEAVCYDHQGINTIFGAFLECPDLQSGFIPGAIAWEDEPNQCRAYEFTVPNIELTAQEGDEVQFLVQVSPIEKIALWGYAAGTATVHASSSECPTAVHSELYGEGEFGQFGNWINLHTDAAILTAGDYPGEFIMFGNGFAGSMMGSYYIGDLGVHEPDPLVGNVGVGAPTSLDVSPINGNIFMCMPYSSKDLQIYRADGEQLQKIPMPNGGSVNCADVTPGDEIWFIEQNGSAFYLHHATAQAEWTWKIEDADSQQILTDLPAVPQIFDLVYEPNTKRLYVYHNHANGTITVYDASSPGPPNEMPSLTKEAIWGYSGPLLFVKGDYFCSGADIEIDQVDTNLSDCRIIVFANFELGGTAVMKFDSDMNMLSMANLDDGPFLTFAISIDPEPSLRRLVFLPLVETYEDNYFLFNPPAGW